MTNQVKSLSKLVDIYYNSVGLNSSLLLNLPVDTRGIVHENEVKNLNELAAYIKATFTKNLALSQPIRTSSTAEGYAGGYLIDNNPDTFWVATADDEKPSITLLLNTAQEANTFMIQEYLPLGQRIKSFTFEVLVNGVWEKVYEGSTIGNKRLIRFETQALDGVRFTVTDSKAQAVFSNMGLFKAPELRD